MGKSVCNTTSTSTNMKNNTFTDSSGDLNNIIVSNLNRLKTKFNVTQKDLAEKTGYSAAAICKYCKGTQYPTIDFLFKLKKEYGISIDDFVSRELFEMLPESKETSDKQQQLEEFELYKKYCGTFLVYYLDTSNYKGRDFNDPAEALVYGVINIHEVIPNLSKPKFEACAILGIDDHNEAIHIKEHLDSLSSLEDITNFIYSSDNKDHQNNIYEGDFEFGTNHAYLSLKHRNVDKALIILYRVPTNKNEFNGGLGVINSGSKGRERMPTAQFMAFSRYPICLSPEEIHHHLLLTYPTFKADNETKELITLFKHYYLPGDNGSDLLSDYQKELIIKVNIETCIKNIITRNLDRYAKVSERDDASWYQLVKREKKNFNK